jgi:hypothetical protein
VEKRKFVQSQFALGLFAILFRQSHGSNVHFRNARLDCKVRRHKRFVEIFRTKNRTGAQLNATEMAQTREQLRHAHKRSKRCLSCNIKKNPFSEKKQKLKKPSDLARALPDKHSRIWPKDDS